MRRLAAALAVGGLVLAGCGQDRSEAGEERELVVFAAASLTEALTRVAADFEAARPGTTVTLSFGSSAGLAQSVVGGAPADVFASASPATMAVVRDAGDAREEPVVFARNALQLAVPPGNPGGVTGLADFARAELALAVCAVEVPCGAAAEKAFAAAGVTPRPDTFEQDVKAVLAKVRLAEVDAGLVYVTDVRAAGDAVEGIALPPQQQASADYPVVALKDAPEPDLAVDFVAALLAAPAQQVLADAGFLPPR